MSHRISTAILLLGATVLSGCSGSKPAPPDPEVEEIIAAHPGMTKTCIDKLREGKIYIPEIHQPNCYEMMPAQRWNGLWNSGWEWTNFCPGPATECPISSEQGDIWLEYPKPAQADGLYQIDFIGRRTRVKGAHGHLNQYDHLMVVDRMISIRKAEKPKQ